MITEEIPEHATKAGYCGKCDRWTQHARIIAEVHGDTGAGGTVLRCASCDAKARKRVNPRARL